MQRGPHAVVGAGVGLRAWVRWGYAELDLDHVLQPVVSKDVDHVPNIRDR